MNLWALYGLLGSVLSLGYITFFPFHFPLFAWVGFFLWVVALYKGSRKQAFLGSGLAGVLFFALVLYWICYVTFAGYLATLLILGGYAALFGLLAHWLIKSYPRSWVWLVPSLWVAIEHFRSYYTFLRFPWFSLAHSQIEWDWIVQSADLWGASGISWLVAFWSTLFAAWCLGERPKAATFFGVLLLVGVTLYSWWRPKNLELKPCLKVSLVQASIPQEVKAAQVDLERIHREHMVLTKKAYKEKPDLIVWPETMFVLRPPFVDDLTSWIRKHRQPMLVGAAQAWRDPEGKLHFANSAIFYGPDGRIVRGENADWYSFGKKRERIAIYNKVYLVPVSEYIPFRETIPILAKFLESWLPPGFYSMDPGDGAKVFRLKGHPFAPSICFEISFSDLMRQAVKKGAHILLNISNDAWFRSSAELDNSRLLARLRAIEVRRAVLRALNGGISCAVDGRGNIQDLVDPQGRKKQIQGVLTVRAKTTEEETLYLRWGDWVAWGSFLFVFLALGGRLFWRSE